MYYVIHSKDPYLLARFCTELQMEGWEPGPLETSEDHPFERKYMVPFPSGYLAFYKYQPMVSDTFTTLTSRNYTDVLEAVLTNKTK